MLAYLNFLIILLLTLDVKHKLKRFNFLRDSRLIIANEDHIDIFDYSLSAGSCLFEEASKDIFLCLLTSSIYMGVLRC